MTFDSVRASPGGIRFLEEPERSAIFLDFDGTLAEIVPRPELARPVGGARTTLARLAERYALVAVVTGRTADEARSLIGVPGLTIFGVYGLEGAGVDTRGIRRAEPEVQAAAARVAGAWVEDKGASLAVHYRAAPDPVAAERELNLALRDVAVRQDLGVLPGKMVIELAPRGTPGKGAVILRETRARRLGACLYAGDDVADLAAFRALDELAAEGLATLKVVVRTAETPGSLVSAANVVVDGPAELVRLLAEL